MFKISSEVDVMFSISQTRGVVGEMAHLLKVRLTHKKVIEGTLNSSYQFAATE